MVTCQALKSEEQIDTMSTSFQQTLSNINKHLFFDSMFK